MFFRRKTVAQRCGAGSALLFVRGVELEVAIVPWKELLEVWQGSDAERRGGGSLREINVPWT